MLAAGWRAVLAVRGAWFAGGKGPGEVGGSVLQVIVWLLVVGSLIALIWYTRLKMASYLDRRVSKSEDAVRADIERYGADAPGIRSELLSPEERQAVLDARRQRDKKGPVTPPAGQAGPPPPAAQDPGGRGPDEAPRQTP